MIVTPRLILRPWRETDLPLFAEQNADPETMRFLGGPMTREQSDAYAGRAERHRETHGFGKWAIEAPGLSSFIGCAGLKHTEIEASFAPAVEMTWRLHRRHWGQGFATEASRAAIADGFERVGLAEIVAMAALLNLASTRVMERLGMTRSIEFDYPGYPEGHPSCRHALFRIRPQ